MKTFVDFRLARPSALQCRLEWFVIVVLAQEDERWSKKFRLKLPVSRILQTLASHILLRKQNRQKQQWPSPFHSYTVGDKAADTHEALGRK